MPPIVLHCSMRPCAAFWEIKFLGILANSINLTISKSSKIKIIAISTDRINKHLTDIFLNCPTRSAWARSKTRKPRKSRKPRKVIFRCFLSEFSSAAYRVYSKTRKMKARKIFSEVSEISEKSEFSNCHFLPNFQKSR